MKISNILLIIKAGIFSSNRHHGQKDDEGLEYFKAHIVNVVQIVRCITKDADLICAAYLHDTIEDTNTTYPEIKEKFNKRIADIVLEVTHQGFNDDYGYYFPRLKSREAILLKFADRLSNLSRMGAWDEKRKQHYLKKSKFWKDGS